MILITCVDEKNGMLFNNRRQSRDRILIDHICNLIGDRKLWVNSFSKELFESQKNNNLITDDDFINKINKDEFCFIENISPVTLVDKIDRIILYNWNRAYPADRYFDIQLENWILQSEKDFVGSSHKKIMERIYIRG